jgi:hypothetical protein
MNQPHLNLPKIITVRLNDVNQSRSNGSYVEFNSKFNHITGIILEEI